jgi:hypothetical protein
MKIHSCLAWAVLLQGCMSSPGGVTLSVGMTFQDAVPLLQSAGARQVQMDMADRTGTDLILSYDLADGSVLVVAVSKSEHRISGLEVCGNPDQPKSKRTWNSVKSVTLRKN